MNYPIAINPDTGALTPPSDTSIGRFVGDTVSSIAGVGVGVVTVGGGAIIAGKKHRGVGALIGLGVCYALWRAGVKIVG